MGAEADALSKHSECLVAGAQTGNRSGEMNATTRVKRACAAVSRCGSSRASLARKR